MFGKYTLRVSKNSASPSGRFTLVSMLKKCVRWSRHRRHFLKTNLKARIGTWGGSQNHSQSENWATWHYQGGQCQRQGGSRQSEQFQFPPSHGAQIGYQNSAYIKIISLSTSWVWLKTCRSSTLSSAYMSSDRLNLKLNWKEIAVSMKSLGLTGSYLPGANSFRSASFLVEEGEPKLDDFQ